jgi:hypothetical protein
MNRALLEKAFEKDEIRQREGNLGKILDYIEGHSVIKRLNDTFEAEWSFTILKHEINIDVDEVFVLGELKAKDIVKTQFGSSKITRDKNTKAIISLADDLKAAATDALKKTATMFGVGLYLYKKSNGSRPYVKKEKNLSPSPSTNSITGNESSNTPDKRKTEFQGGKIEIGFQPVDSAGTMYKPKFNIVEPEKMHTRSRSAKVPDDENGARQMTIRQFQYIKSMGKKLGYDIEKLSQKCVEKFNHKLEHLTTSEASLFIQDVIHAGK